LGLSVLLIACNGKEATPSSDPALSQGTTHTTQPPQQPMLAKSIPDAGPCKAQIEKFYFDPATKNAPASTTAVAKERFLLKPSKTAKLLVK